MVAKHSYRVEYSYDTRFRVSCQGFFGGFFEGMASYLYLPCSAIIDRRVAEAPRGLYIPVSHSLIVC